MEHPIATQSLRWIIFLPLLGAVINGLFGRVIQKQFGKNAISILACAPVWLAFAISLSVFFQLRGVAPEERALLDNVWDWIHIGDLHAPMAFWADPLSATLLLVVTGVGGLIHIYSVAYMHDDAAFWRFFAYLNLFTAMMLTLVLGDNILVMFVGWEGVGLCSFALIGFWYEEYANATAGSKAFIVNRVGDFAFVVGAFLLFWTMSAAGHGSVIFREINQHAEVLSGKTFWGMDVVTVVTMLFFIGATGKSAQIPLYVWLPDAMAGPTPVSALIHAATMVTAGVYMIGRTNVLFSMAPTTLHVVAFVGGLTALFAATIGTAQNDIKKVLAYSTVSQLGYMFLGMGVGAYAAGIYHLVTHAFFKACLFLGSGSVIHAMHHEQDMRKMGGLRKWMPITHWTFLISTLCLTGFPFTSGFFSKDEILWKAWSSENGSPLFWLMGFCGAGLTAFYMFRQVYMTFYGEFRGGHHDDHGQGHGHGQEAHPHESPLLMTLPLAILATMALVIGLVGIPHSLGGSLEFEQWLAPVFEHGHEAVAHHAAHGSSATEYLLMAMSVGIAFFGIFVATSMYLWKTWSPDFFTNLAGGKVYTWVYNKYYVDELYQETFINGTLRLSQFLAWFDRTIVDGIVNGAATVVRGLSFLNGMFDQYVIDGIVNRLAEATLFTGQRFRQMQTGSINAYLYVVVGAVVVMMVVELAWAG